MALDGLLRSRDDDADADDVPEVPSDASSLMGAPDGPADELPQDPQPSRRSRKAARKMRPPAASRTATKSEQNQVRDAVSLLFTVPAWGLQMRDAHCGGVLMAQRQEIIDAFVPIICRNPAMLAFFTAVDAPWMAYLALFKALAPVAQAIWGHHVTHTVGDDQGAAGGGRVDLSAYSAPVYT